MAEEKKTLRRDIKKRREALSEDYIRNASERIADHVTESRLFQESSVVFCYISMDGEPDTRRIIEAALSAGKTVCVPKCFEKGIMTAVPIRSQKDLVPGMLDIPEPKDWSHPLDEKEIDLGVIPCISANRKGERIGHGAGYYDRFLQKSSCRTLCLCFEKLLSEQIPMDEHDRLMDAVATEEGLFEA